MIIFLELAIAASVSFQSPQAEYETYLKQFADAKAISGTFMARGGPVSQPTCSTFRIAAGGRYKIFADSSEKHSDGSNEYSYFPSSHSYQVALPSTWMYQILFGQKFGAKHTTPFKASSQSSEDFEGQKATVFKISPGGVESEIELIIRASDKRPLALRTRGNQSTYTTSVAELHTNRSYAEESWKWIPPPGTQKKLP